MLWFVTVATIKNDSLTAILLTWNDQCKIPVRGKYSFGEEFKNKFHCYRWDKKDIKNSWCLMFLYLVEGLKVSTWIFMFHKIFFKKVQILRYF